MLSESIYALMVFRRLFWICL